MTNYQRQKIDMELRNFTSKHMMKPSECRDLEQIKFYVQELAKKIEQLEAACNFAPAWAYALLAQYNAKLNTLLWADFRKDYH